jgi:hypothetical protein
MCGGDLPKTRMEWLLFAVTEEPAEGIVDSNGYACEVTADSMAIILGTTPQVVGKIMKWCWYLWERKVIKGKVTFVPKGVR